MFIEEVTPPPFVPINSCVFDSTKAKFLVGLTISVALIIFGALALNGTIKLSAEPLGPTLAYASISIGSFGFVISALYFASMTSCYNEKYGSNVRIVSHGRYWVKETT